MNFKLSPSDLTFTYGGCKRCFYMKVVHGITQPSIPIPSVFSTIAGLLKDYYSDKRTEELHTALPPGTVTHGEKFVKSQTIRIPGHDSTCYISGRFDIVVSFDDKTYGVIDFKTGNPDSESSAMYSRQLQAYAYALEHPALNSLNLAPITRLGLLYFHPDGISQNNLERLSYDANITWVEVNNDEEIFLQFVEEVLNVLESPEPPECSPECRWCGYVTRMKNFKV